MNPHPRRILTPGAPRKRKEMEVLRAVIPAARFPPPPAKPAFSAAPPDPGAAEPIPANLVVAGYMAHEYLTRGTIFGQRWDPGRAEAVPVSGETKKARSGGGQAPEPSPKGSAPKENPNRSYAEVASLLKSGGAHIPGIVNPAQLARWFEM